MLRIAACSCRCGSSRRSCRSIFVPSTRRSRRLGENRAGRRIHAASARRSKRSSGRRRSRRRLAVAGAGSRSQHLRAAVRQHERRPGAGVFLRRHHRGHHHRPWQGLGAVDRLAQPGLLVQGGQGRCRRDRPADQVRRTCWSAACARRAIGFASRRNSSTRRTRRKCGASAMTATSKTSSRCRTRSRRPSSRPSSSRCCRRKSARSSSAPPPTSRPTSST